MKTETLSIDLLTIDGDTQARVSIHEDTVDDYAELITGKEWPFEPLDIFTDGNRYLVADGFHRTLAAQKAKRASIPCRVHKGTAKDAKIFGMTANDRHGLRMSRADKRHCVEWLLDNGGKMTQADIAKTAGVAVRTVKYIVAERKPEKVQIAPSVSENTGKTTKTSGGKAPAASQDQPGEGQNQQTQSDPDSAPNIDYWATPADDVEADEPTPEPAKEPWRLARSKAKKTAEALQRALGDLNDVRKFAYLETALSDCKEIIVALDALK